MSATALLHAGCLCPVDAADMFGKVRILFAVLPTGGEAAQVSHQNKEWQKPLAGIDDYLKTLEDSVPQWWLQLQFSTMIAIDLLQFSTPSLLCKLTSDKVQHLSAHLLLIYYTVKLHRATAFGRTAVVTGGIKGIGHSG